MSLSKEVLIDQITVTENGAILIREVTRIMEDNIEISKQYHRTSFMPGDNVSLQPDNVKAICNTVWTPEVISAYQQQSKASI